MAKSRQQIESAFRTGTNAFFAIAGLSALGTTALYKGWVYAPLHIVSLATPMVLDTMARTVPPRFFGGEIHYYCYVFSVILAGIFALLGLLCRYSSHTGTFLKVGSLFGSFAKLGSALGVAHLVGSRLFYFTGIVLYTLDGVLALGIENLMRKSPAPFTDLRMIVLFNLAFHCLMLAILLFGFVSGLESEKNPKSEA